MNENQKYKAIQKILKKVSLKPRDSDWEKMNGLLNRHLPVKAPSVSPFHSVKLLVYGGSAVLISAVSIMIHNGFQKSKKQKQEVIHAKQTNQNIDSGRTAQLPEINKGTLQNLSIDSSSCAKTEKATITDSNSIAALRVGYSDIAVKKGTVLTVNRQLSTTNYLAHQNFSEGGSTVNRQPSTASSAGALAKRGQLSTHDQPAKMKMVNDVAVYLSDQRAANLELEKEKHSKWISGTLSNKKGSSGGLNVSAGNKVSNKKTDGGSYFRTGFGIPLVQYYLTNPNQVFQMNYIPGLTGQYVINKHWVFGLNIFPFQKIPISDKDSIYTSFGRDSSISPNNFYTKNYYLNNLNAWASEINLEYQINEHLGINAGLGLQGIWNAKGYVTTLSADTLYNPPNQPSPGNHTTTQDMHYSRTDQRLSNLEKSNFYYFLNLVYHTENWSVSLGYNQNGKTWLPTSGNNSPGWIRLQFNYYFLTGKK